MESIDTEAKAAAYLASLVHASPAGAPATSLPTPPYRVDEIHGGNLNHAFCVRAADNRRDAQHRACFLKHAPEHIKCLGPGYPCDGNRACVEARALRAYNAIAPHLVPTLLHLDEPRRAMVLGFLEEHELLRETLARGAPCGAHLRDVARFMALTHVATRRGAADARLEEEMANPAMCAITAAYVFAKPLDPSDATNRRSAAVEAEAAALCADERFGARVRELQSLFLGAGECLVHGDLHSGSVMVPRSGVGHARVIDAEFAHFGAPMFDVGTFFAHLVFSALAQPCEEALQHGLAGATGFCSRYLEEVTVAQGASGQQPLRAGGSLRRCWGFAGCELMRRVIGAAHSPDIDGIADAAARSLAERRALRLAVTLVEMGTDAAADGAAERLQPSRVLASLRQVLLLLPADQLSQ